MGENRRLDVLREWRRDRRSRSMGQLAPKIAEGVDLGKGFFGEIRGCDSLVSRLRQGSKR